MSKAKLTLHFKGGPGSGHRGHAGRPGKRGGSLPGKGVAAHAEEYRSTRTSVTAEEAREVIGRISPYMFEGWRAADIAADKDVWSNNPEYARELVALARAYGKEDYRGLSYAALILKPEYTARQQIQVYLERYRASIKRGPGVLQTALGGATTNREKRILRDQYAREMGQMTEKIGEWEEVLEKLQ